MSRIRRFIAVTALVVPLAACGFEAPAPKRLPPAAAPPPPLSTLSVSLSISADEIARLLDARTEHHLADIRDKPVKCAIGRCRLTLLATREGPIETRAENGQLMLEVPFGIDADLSLPGFLSMVRATGNAEGVAFTDISARVSPDWQLHTNSEAHVELHNSHLRVGPVVTDLTEVLNQNEEILSRPLSKEVDREIAHGVHLRDKVEKAWQLAFQPIKVGKKPPAWLVLAPERLMLSGPGTDGSSLKLVMAVQVRAQVLTQNAAPKPKPSPLPPPSVFKAPTDRFSFIVSATISYDDAAALALKSLQKKALRVAGMNVRFTKLSFLPSRDDVVVAAGFCIDQDWDPTGWFSSCGSGYLRGTPTFDAQSETIRVTHVHYDPKTEGVLVGTMRSLAGPGLGRALEPHLKFSVSRDLARLRSQAAAALAKPQGRDVTISGKIEAFDPPKLSWTKDGFVALFSAQGSVHADLHV